MHHALCGIAEENERQDRTGIEIRKFERKRNGILYSEAETMVDLTYEHCNLCPRLCGVNRAAGGRGFCGGGAEAAVAKVMLHRWEEPWIGGARGSGAVFFSGCNLRCDYCQNRKISAAVVGQPMTAEALCGAVLGLQAQGAASIDLVTATPYLPTVLDAMRAAKARGLSVPVVYNTGGYEREEAIDALAEVVDVWLPDLKYADGGLAEKYSRAADYPETAVRAIDRMVARAGAPCVENGVLKRGVVVRHLVLPSHRADSLRVVETVAERWGTRVLFSLMRQYTPAFASDGCDLKRRVTAFEYNTVLARAVELGLRGWRQDADSADAAFTPDF